MIRKTFVEKNIAILLYVTLCWIIPADIHIYASLEVKVQNILIAAIVLVAVLLYCILNHKYKIFVLALSIIALKVSGVGYGAVFSFCAGFVALYLYEVIFADKKVNENIKSLLLTVTPIVSFIGILFNFKQMISNKHGYHETLIVMIIFFSLFFSLNRHAKNSKMNKDQKTTFSTIMVIAQAGVISTASLVNSQIYNEVMFLPWLLFVIRMISNKDIVFCEMLLLFGKKLKKFLS